MTLRWPHDGPPPPENGQQVIERMAKLLGHAPTMRVTLRDEKGRTVAVETVARRRAPGPWDSNGNDR